jgi:cobyrinic acid a,c-diamide synthase
MKKSIVLHYKRGKKIYAECGGLMYMTESIRGMDGGSAKMVGILKGHAAMTERSGCQGMQATPLPEGILRGHAHHRSTLDTDIVPISYGQRTRNAAPGEPIYRMAGLTASYLHSYFPSNPEATAAIFNNNDRLVE